ncbi:hypothetical protein [Tenacibaculum sp. M341]|uniref:hypothetical protein n=1 Tax=Tenacibaculum sp. M341 TaxID=2530339 RepID=UPI00104AB59C|nr:hypothetical protein [Tenacibaculum sp. M341]TCI93034.1 hypothetical protein EYW44_05285 [Tenacibaculum sp. M341]
MKKEIILESKFTSHQKTHILMVFGAPIILVIIKLISLDITNSLLSLLFVCLFLIVVSVTFLKTGLLKEDNSLYRGVYFLGKLIFKKKISLEDKNKVTILSFKKSQKMAWFSAANPDLSLTFYRSDITLLNEKHTRKEMLVSLDNEYLANEVLNFLEIHFALKHEVYSPDFS